MVKPYLAEKLLAAPAQQHIAVWPDLAHKGRAAQRQPQPLALAHGVVVNAKVGAQCLSIGADKLPGRGVQPAGGNIGRMVAVRNKADLHAVGGVGAFQLRLPCHFSDLRLLIFAQRQQKAAQHLLPKAVQHIGLVTRIAFGAANAPHALLILLNTRIMPGGDLFTAKAVSSLHKRTEFHIRIAQKAGVGGAPGAVAGAERRGYMGFKIRPRIQHGQRHIQLAGSRFGFLHGFFVCRAE